jgi:hypothetical protein
LYEVGLQLHYQLKHYKDDDGSKMAWDFLVKTAALLGYFLKQHGGCISTAAGGAWDVITSVPSSTNRPGEHPLATAIKLVPHCGRNTSLCFAVAARLRSTTRRVTTATRHCAAIVPIGRVISPEYNEDFWKRQSRLVFDFDVCCVGEHS